jgi:(heptosyl)LPS beta-1,4-glucosyltransferase
MAKLSVVVNTLNEEKNLARCLTSVKDLADEIVVVDMHSSDDTVKIAKKFGAKVYNHKKAGYVEPARNYAMGKASGEWIFILDADEEASVGLKKKIKELISKPDASYYRIPRKNIVFGKWMEHSRWWPDYNIRLFKKGSVSWSEIIHSVPTTIGEGADLEAKEDFAIIHHNYQSISQYIDRLNRYSDKQAEALLKEKKYKFAWQDLIRKPVNEFVSRFFAGEGYKDGVHGLALATLQAFSELSVYLKVWEKKKFKQADISIYKINKEITEVQKDINYWKANSEVNEGAGMMAQIKRKLKLQ